jgi:hypothetical protein
MAGVRLTGFLCLGILAAALIFAGSISRLAPPRCDEHVEIMGSKCSASLLPGSLSYVLVAVLLLLMSIIIISGYIQGDISYDGNAYHLLSINRWAVTGNLHEVDPAFEASPFVNGYPKGAELVAFVFARAFGPRFIEMLNLIYAPLGFLGIALLCQLFGAGWRDSVVFGACYLLVPANLDQYGSTEVDAAFASSVIALLALLAVLLRAEPKGWFWESCVTGCAIGNVIAIKGTGPLIAAASVGSFLVCDIALSWRLYRLGRVKYSLVGASSVVALAVGGFWYVKNYIYYRNPIYPVAVTIGRHNIWVGVPFAMIFQGAIPAQLRVMHPLIRLVVSWLAPILRSKPWYHSVVLGSLGELWVLACIPAIMASCHYLRSGMGLSSKERATYCLLAASVLVALLITPLSFTSRYTIWLFALGMPSIYIVLGAAQGYRGALRRFLKYWVTACVSLLIFQAVALVSSQGITWVAVRGSAGPVPVRVSWREIPILPLFPEMRSPLLKEILETEAPIGIGPQRGLGHARRIHGQVAQPIGRHDLVPVSPSGDATDMRRLSSVAGLQYILWVRDKPIPPVLAQNVTSVESDGPFTLLKLISQPIHGASGP